MSEQQLRINTLSGGVSRLPDSKRTPQEAQDLTNAVVSPEKSLQKRDALELVAFPGTGYMSDDVDEGDLWFHTDRDNDEIYLYRISETAADAITVWNILDQTTDTVSLAAGTPTYLASGSGQPKNKIGHASVGDGIFLFNKEVTLAYESDTAEGGGALRYENETNNSKYVDERIFTTEANYPGQKFDDEILGQNFRDWSEFNAEAPTAQDLTAHNGAEDIVGTGKVYYARENYLNYATGFYKAISNTAQPWFERIRTQEDESVFAADTFPHLLFNTTPGTWDFDAGPWTPRVSGPTYDNPGPSVFRQPAPKVSAMATWRNRLWFSSQQTLFTSRYNDYFDLWIDDSQNITDEDPIDIIGGSSKVANATSLTPFSEFLFVNTDNKVQFEVQGVNNFIGPASASMAPTSFFGTTPEAEPVTMGSTLFFIDSNRLYVYFPSTKASLNQAHEVSYHAREFLPKNPEMMTPIEFNSSLCWVDGDNKNDIYFYASRFAGDKQTQSAFYRWRLDPSVEVQHMFVSDTYLYVVAAVDNKLYLFKSDLEVLGTKPLMDKLHEVSGTYADGKTTFTSALPLSTEQSKRIVVLGDQWGTHEGTVEQDTDDDNMTVVINGDHTAFPVFIGERYEMRATLSKQFMRDDRNNTVPGSMSLKNCLVQYDNSGHFDVEVIRAGRTTSKSLTTADNFRVNGQILLGEKKWRDGQFLAKLAGDSEHTQISILSSYPEPLDITQIELSVNFNAGFRTSNHS